jgi:hypothetical protein
MKQLDDVHLRYCGQAIKTVSQRNARYRADLFLSTWAATVTRFHFTSPQELSTSLDTFYLQNILTPYTITY